MADLKKRVLTLTTGKKIELFGNSLAIGKSLEIAEGYAPNVLARNQSQDKSAVSNPHKLTAEEIHEIADFNIRLWIELKEKVRRYGTADLKLFNPEGR